VWGIFGNNNRFPMMKTCKILLTFLLVLVSSVCDLYAQINFVTSQITADNCWNVLKFDANNYFLMTRTTVKIASSANGPYTSTNWPLGIVRDNTSAARNFGKQGNRLLVGAQDNGVYISNNLGQAYTHTFSNGFGTQVWFIMETNDGGCLMSNNGFLRGIYKVTTNSNSWSQKLSSNAEFWDACKTNSGHIYTVASSANHIGGVYKSTNHGETWSLIRQTSYQDNPTAIFSMNDSVYYVTHSKKLFSAHVNSSNFTLISDLSNILGGPSDLLVEEGGKMFIASYGSGNTAGVFGSVNYGITWSRINIPGATEVIQINRINGDLYVTSNVGLFRLTEPNISIPRPKGGG